MTIDLAIKALLRNKSRSILTMLGIIIGIASVIIIISAGQGAKSLILGELEGIGANLISTSPGKLGIPNTGQGVLRKRFYDLTVEQPGLFRYVIDSAPAILFAGTAGYKEITKNGTVLGTIPSAFPMYNFKLADGRLFTIYDDRKASNVVVLGAKIAKDLFADESPLGKSIHLAQQNWTVIGVLQDKGSVAGQDSYIFAPISTVEKKLKNSDSLDSWDFLAADQNAVLDAKAEIRAFLRKQNNLTADQEDNFSIQTAEDSINTINSILSYITIFLTLLASISLVVGGIGIMNIMLVSVTERTKEIGLRKALGAKYRDILKQFLVEAFILTIIGGIIGIIVGCIGAIVVAAVGKWATDVPLSSIIVSVGICAACGIIFGYYPAKKAALLDPIQALRTE